MWDDAMSALRGARLVSVDYGEMQGHPEDGDMLTWGQSWTLYLEGGGAVELGAVGVRDEDQPFEHGVSLRATFYPNAAPPIEAEVDG